MAFVQRVRGNSKAAKGDCVQLSHKFMTQPKLRCCLVALGAVQVSQWLECHVLRAPGGHLLCVIPVHSDPGAFKAQATTWPL